MNYIYFKDKVYSIDQDGLNEDAAEDVIQKLKTNIEQNLDSYKKAAAEKGWLNDNISINSSENSSSDVSDTSTSTINTSINNFNNVSTNTSINSNDTSINDTKNQEPLITISDENIKKQIELQQNIDEVMKQLDIPTTTFK